MTPQWQADLHEVRRLTDGPIGVGTEHEFVRVFAGRRLASRNRFVEFEPGRYVAFEIPEGWLTGRASYLAEPSPSGGTLLTCRMQFKVRRPGSLLDPILKRLLARDSGRADAQLKAAAGARRGQVARPGKGSRAERARLRPETATRAPGVCSTS